MALTYKISQSLIDKYAAGPSTQRTSQVKSLHEDIRQALENWGDKKFDTFLQGSYRNGTAIADINDVDIVALYDPWYSPESHERWEWLFNHIAYILRRTSLVSGQVTIGDKCVKLDGGLKADIVPAISRTAYSSVDPIKVYSRRQRLERDNYPRTHYENGVKKQAATGDSYKSTVRLFKRWIRQYPTLTAPSFYIECAVHSIENSSFNTYLPLSFASVSVELLKYRETSIISSVAGDKDILVSAEWAPGHFVAFQQALRRDLPLVTGALEASTTYEADRLWRSAFGD
ncbi:nucleotidyltransferase [Nonomuraea wenchangensis]